nr:AAA family ATPase [Acutalibacter sp. 1XD8-36]
MISLAGYRSYSDDIEKNKIDLHDVNIIIGANGAGKSNLISFLEMVSYMMTRGLRSYVAKQGAQALFHVGPKHTEQIRGQLVIADGEGDKEDTYSFSLERSVSDQLFFAQESMSYQDRWHFAPYESDYGVGHNESGLADAYDPTSRTLRDYLARLKVFHFNDTSINSRIRSSTNTTDDAYLRSDGGNIAAFLYRMRTDLEEVPYYERIKEYIRMVLPQFYDFVLEPDANGRLPLNWQQAGSEEIFGPHQFSDGALRFVALTTLLLQPSRTAPMTIILDEPEIGLHPMAISLLAKEIRMASKTSQIIVSTQSPLLLNQFSCNDVITADYDAANQCSVLRRHKESELRDWLEEYTLGELWEKNVLGGLPL